MALIAEKLGRDRSSLYREKRRNKDPDDPEIGYLPDRAHMFAKERRKAASSVTKLSRNPELKELIIEKMKDDKWSPAMISGRLKHEKAKVQISHESIYQFVYSDEGMDRKLYQHLMRRRPKRNQKYGRKTRGNYGIPQRVSISERPVIKAHEIGHFEADTTFFKGSKSINLLTMVDRNTGYFIANLNATKDSKIIATKMLNNMINIPKNLRKTITMDNGKEFVLHHIIKQITGMPTYFCNPGSPWQKPYVETTHALLHRFIQKNTDPKTLNEEEVQHAVNKVNNLPRKRFNFRTPAEMIDKHKKLHLVALRS